MLNFYKPIYSSHPLPIFNLAKKKKQPYNFFFLRKKKKVYISIYNMLNPRLLIQVINLSYTQSRMSLDLCY